MNTKLFVTCFAAISALGLLACGSSDKPGGGAAGSGAGGGAGSGASMHTCAQLATCCSGATFAAAVAKPNSQLSAKQCTMIATGTNEAACNSLYNGYQLLSACP